MDENNFFPETVAPSPGAEGSSPDVPPGYELLGEVGRGGMGVVYRAHDVTLDREVAVKLLHDRYAADSPIAMRFLEEARITGQLQHPGIPAVYRVGALADGRPFLAMKLIKGRTLLELLKAGPPVDPLAIFEAIAQTVGYAHAHGVIHRDLKPANVMVGSFGEVQVMDWGLAKVLSSGRQARPGVGDAEATGTEIRTGREAETPYTQHGSVLGTPAYMAPEQAAGEVEKVDTRSDVFGLGAILCVLLTGKPPYEGGNAESARLNAIRGRTKEAFTRLEGCGADPDVVAVCTRCLAFEPGDRPATADEVAAAVTGLRRAADERARQAERDKLAAEVRAAEQVKRRRSLQWAAGVVATVLLLGVAGTTAGLVLAYAARRTLDNLVTVTKAERKREAEDYVKALNWLKMFRKQPGPDRQQQPDPGVTKAIDNGSIVFRTLSDILEPSVPSVILDGRTVPRQLRNRVDSESFNVMELYRNSTESASFPLLQVDLIANTFVRLAYQDPSGTGASLGTSVQGSPSFRLAGGELRSLPRVFKVEVATEANRRVVSKLTAEFLGIADVFSSRAFPVPIPERTIAEMSFKMTALSPMVLDSDPDRRSKGDVFRFTTISSMFTDDRVYDTNVLLFEDPEGNSHVLRLTGNTPRGAYLFPRAMEVGRWLELVKEPGSLWFPDSPSIRMDIKRPDGVGPRLGIQGWLSRGARPNEDSFTVWVEWLDAPSRLDRNQILNFRYTLTASPPRKLGFR